jgi:uncharacterized RDD family membrane protein YckC
MNNYAGLWIRIKAFLWDYLILLVYIALVTIILWLFRIPEFIFTNRIQSQIAGVFILTLPVVLYFSISESSNKQGTWGKRREKLIVTSRDEKKISFGRAFSRNLLKFLPWEISHTLVWESVYNPDVGAFFINSMLFLVYGLIGLNLASLVLTKTHQGLYDLVTGTFVQKNHL